MAINITASDTREYCSIFFGDDTLDIKTKMIAETHKTGQISKEVALNALRNIRWEAKCGQLFTKPYVLLPLLFILTSSTFLVTAAAITTLSPVFAVALFVSLTAFRSLGFFLLARNVALFMSGDHRRLNFANKLLENRATEYINQIASARVHINQISNARVLNVVI